jgi:curli biogenesis system outer membrane secretion channel CsgG
MEVNQMPKKLYLLLLLTIIIGFRAALPVQGASDGRLRVAVLPFDDGSVQGRDRWWGPDWRVGSSVSDELTPALFNTGKFRLIEREQIHKVLAEQNLGDSGRIEPRTAARLGRILGAQILIIGKVTEFSTDSKGAAVDTPRGVGFGIRSNTARVTIDARMVDTTSAEILATASGHGEKKQTSIGLRVDFTRIEFGSNEFRKTNLGVALRDAVNALAEQLAAKADAINPVPPSRHSGRPTEPIFGKVATIYGNKIYLNIGDRDGVYPGMKFRVYRVVKTVKDPNTGKIIDYITEPTAIITVISVKRDSAVCRIRARINSKYRVAAKDIVKQIP